MGRTEKRVLGHEGGNNVPAYADDLSRPTSPYEQKYMFSACLINDCAYLSAGDKRRLIRASFIAVNRLQARREFNGPMIF